MENKSFVELKKVFDKYVRKSSIDVIGEIIENESPNLLDKFVKECGTFLTDTFTFVKEMNNVPIRYRETLFKAFFGNKKTDISKKWFKTTFRNDTTYEKHLSGHINCLAIGLINELKRKYGILNVKYLPKNVIIEIDGIRHQLIEDNETNRPCDICSLSDLCDDCGYTCPVGICVDLFKGNKNSYFKRL